MQSQRPARHRFSTSTFRPPSMRWLSHGIWLAVMLLFLTLVFGDTSLFFVLLVSILLVSGVALLVRYFYFRSRFDRRLRRLFNRRSVSPLFGLGLCCLGIGFGCLTILPAFLTDVLALFLAGALFLAPGCFLAYRGLIRSIQA